MPENMNSWNQDDCQYTCDKTNAGVMPYTMNTWD